jgi:glycerophosphoryl diester phosphodiesterase
MFLTDAGQDEYPDIRCKSLDEAFKFCVSYKLNGCVSNIIPLLGLDKNPDISFDDDDGMSGLKETFTETKEILKMFHAQNMFVFTYGGLNNMEACAFTQIKLGIDGVIVDDVKKIRSVFDAYMKK